MIAVTQATITAPETNSSELQAPHLEAVLHHAMQPRRLKAELLLDHLEGVLAPGANVGLGCLNQILQIPV